ncbi:CAAX prenyl protease-related protein [Aquabacterium sp. A7-Y]|uniref:CAAX prenyl protease-related protein n=1 Tax=Aquabacterium sp. A7-Y TaxID=1349605 RepID=UPI00223E68FA|nr:CAAX prenyl protease-related protein [Aquabacterium sp. A7-Y]MCW7539994.1 CAAX prenyl protease-related protein [Aquabacterium sp. A7-Y]
MPFQLSRAALARIVPFALFMILLVVRGAVPEDSGLDGRWIYGVCVVAVAAVLVGFRREYVELARATAPRLGEWVLAIGVGLAVFGLWIHMDLPWMVVGEPTASFTPVDAEGRLDWPLIVVRWIGAALLVPVMEELFWRSFLMRWLEQPQFEGVDPRRVGLKAIALSTGVFALAHTLWLAAIVAGLAYAWLYRHTGKLWVPVISHAVTNGVLGVWVVTTGEWAFW